MINTAKFTKRRLYNRRLNLMRSAFVDNGWIGVLFGYIVMTLFLPGGDDGYQFYLKPYWPDATAPAWVFLITAPANPLTWPLRWTYLVIISGLVVIVSQRVLGSKRWWIQFFNQAFFMNLWLGQIEAFPIAGVALSWLVLQRRAHPAVFGIGALLLLTKVQVGGGIVLLFAFWLWREQGFRALLRAAGLAACVLAFTLLVYPNWPEYYLNSLRTLGPQDQWWNGAIYPIGLLTIPLAFYPGDVGKIRRARMIACITLLASPYLAWYHPSTAMLFEARIGMMWLSWIDAIPRALFNYTHIGWITPMLMLCWDVWQIWHERRSPIPTDAKP